MGIVRNNSENLIDQLTHLTVESGPGGVISSAKDVVCVEITCRTAAQSYI